jgi:hypothetical protein
MMMMQNTVAEVTRLSQFLGYERDEKFIRDVVSACDFASMKSRKGHFDLTTDGQAVMYRKGQFLN